MKKSINIIYLSLTLTFLLMGCSDSFLDVKVQGGETTDSDPKLASKLVTGVYNSLLQGDCFGDGDVHGFGFISITNIISDDADKGSTANDQAVPVGDIDNFTLTSTNKFCETIWAGHFNGIGAANVSLQALNKTTAIAATDLNKLKAEVRFIRGYLYFNMVRMFGDVPLVLNVPKNLEEAETDPLYVTRAPVAKVYDSLISDMQYAVDHLEVRSKSSTGHIDKGTAQSMLAKVYMYLKQWDKVYALTNEVITSGEYKLVDDYATIWRQEGDNSKESIFEINTGKFNNDNLRIDNYTNCQAPRSGGKGGWNDLGWGFNDPSLSLINAYEVGDLRKDATIIFIDKSGTHKGTRLWDGYRLPSSDSVQNLYYNYKAYTSSVDPSKESYAIPASKDRPKNIHILRYADVLLMNAEASLKTTQGDAAGRVNMVRARAGLAAKGSVSIDDIWQERHVEFAMEHDRFWDIVRQGRAAQVMHDAGKANFIEGVHELLPVPNSQIVLSGNKLSQNFGY